MQELRQCKGQKCTLTDYRAEYRDMICAKFVAEYISSICI